uniref:F-box domain-containing protein n=1 Tax=Oryza punctata TaxID=4537 RepID=A0A0E0MHK8_ORYPU
MADDDDRLSDLPDDLLRRILHFIPVREAASTSLLSRRWGSLWRSSGAVNLIEHEEEEEEEEDDEDVLAPETAEGSSARRRDAFLRAAGAALTAAADDGDSSCNHVTRLSVDVHATNGCWIWNFLNGDEAATADDDTDVLHAVVSHPAARLVEELRLRVTSDKYDIDRAKEEEPRWNRGVYGLNLASLPFEMLRVLDIAGCNNLSLPPPAAAVAFPQLQTLRLRQCTAKLTHLQRLIDAAPWLATVHFESVVFDTDANHPSHHLYHSGDSDSDACSIRLRCPEATSLVLEMCGSSDYKFYGRSDGRCGSIAIDAPKLRTFRYKGLARPFYLKSPEMTTAVSLHFIHNYRIKDDTTRVHYWRFIGNFTNTKKLKLKVHNLEHLTRELALTGKASRSKLLSVFPNLECLELETKKSAVAIANLLHCCPALGELTMKLSTTWTTATYWPNLNDKSCCHGRFQPDFDESVDQFMRGKSNTTTAISSINSRKGNGDIHVDEVPDIPALSQRSFTCLQRSLKKVSLKFKWRSYDCLGVQLFKFFAQNAMVLEEMWIDSGDRKLCDHMNLNVERWVGVDSSKISLKHKNFADSTWEFSRICPDSTPEELETTQTQIDRFASPPPTMAGDDRLSNLADDLLRRILHFVPAREATFTGLLSRRWRSLWRSTGAVNLTMEEAFSSRHEAFIGAARAALTAAAAAASPGSPSA